MELRAPVHQRGYGVPCCMRALVLKQQASGTHVVAGSLAEFANESAPGSYVVGWQEGSSLKDKDAAANAVLVRGDGQEAVGERAIVAELPGGTGEWAAFAQDRLGGTNFRDLDAAFAELDHHLVMRSYVDGYAATAADAALWGALRASAIFQRNLKAKTQALGDAIVRWYAHISTQPFAQRLAASLAEAVTAAAAAKKGKKGADQGSFDLGLEGVVDGGVVTRFPPEPSGYMHVGHAKAALLNEYFARTYNGKLIVRFDDTNPEKEKEEFEDAITEDLKLLGIHADVVSHTSDHFAKLFEYAVELTKKGLAYVDDTDKETMREQRGEGIASRCRDLSVEENLQRLEQMRQGTEFGQTCCLRAKMSVDSPNKAMRDPTIYRCIMTPHHRTGTQWKVYPTYEFCCPVVDSLEGVTHALRSMEYRDRNPVYEWFFPALGLRPVAIKDFSRMNFVYTLLSKRKLQWFVDNGLVGGWDDPRFPTVRGISRRGMTIEALRQYVLMQGASQKNMLLEWDKIWSLNKRVIDPVAPRHTAVVKKGLVPVAVVGGPEEPYVRDVPRHKKNPELGDKQTVFSPLVFIDQADAASFAVHEEITLMDWGNAIVAAVEKDADGTVTGATLHLHLDGDVKATKKKITWLGQSAAVHPVEAVLVDYDYLITKKKLEEEDSVQDVLTPTTQFTEAAIVDANIGQLEKGAIVQLERRGYYIVDQTAKESELGLVTLIMIPDGKATSLALKHQGGDETPGTPASAAKKGAKSNPWDKAAAKHRNGNGAAPKAAAGPDVPLGLPRPEDVSAMYATLPVYGDMALEDPSAVTSMYQTSKFY
ncbi:glutamate--tRNA ligase [Coemansia biformis]|uniref:Probable glutamate--tRNA ligase, cytoplasmic n=1 Tax=Coemansia biformis TaxID=1286918 RepID=A0A9W7YIM0_9FUNG|nr:glutamate--tRNA ligase [Coemansia biformis]